MCCPCPSGAERPAECVSPCRAAGLALPPRHGRGRNQPRGGAHGPREVPIAPEKCPQSQRGAHSPREVPTVFSVSSPAPMPGAQCTQTVPGSGEKHSLRDKPGKENTSIFESLGLRQSLICWHFPGVGSGRTTTHLRSQLPGNQLPFLVRAVSPMGTEHNGFEELVVETWGRVLTHTERLCSTDPAAHHQHLCSSHGAQG